MNSRILSRTSMTAALIVSALVSAVPTAVASDVDAQATFEQLKSLAGEWRGIWNPGETPTTVTYSLTGKGSVLIEEYQLGENPKAEDTTMATLYHLDGNNLMLTHYCSAGNQPRMRATSSAADGTIVFDFFDITNNVTGGYSEKLTVRLIDEDRISLSYTGSRTGGTSKVELERVR